MAVVPLGVPVIVSAVVKIPVAGLYVTVLCPESSTKSVITVPVAVEELPVIVSPVENVPEPETSNLVA